MTRALQPHLARFDLQRQRLLQVLEGARVNLVQTRFLDYPGLAGYCHLVGGVVAEMAAGIFGGDRDATGAYARRLGLALRLVGILRGVGDDARRGRIYLPLDELQRFGVKPADILAGRYVDGYSALMRFEAQRARGAFAQAMADLPQAQRRAQRPGLILGADLCQAAPGARTR